MQAQAVTVVLLVQEMLAVGEVLQALQTVEI